MRQKKMLVFFLENRRLLKGTTEKDYQPKRRIPWDFPGFIDASRYLLIKNVHAILAKKVLIPLELTAASSATEAVIQKKTYGLGITPLITQTTK